MVAPKLTPGARCGRFTILEALDPSPIAERYLAADERDPASRVVVACARSEDDMGGARLALSSIGFLRRVARLKRVVNPGAPRIVSGGAAAGVPWVASEHVAGGPLSSFRPLPDPKHTSPLESLFTRALLAIGVGQAVGETLRLFAKKGFVHGLLDPRRTLWVTRENTARVLEIGYTKLFGVSRAAMLNDPLYRAPEQLDGAEGDHRSDIYSLGLILHEYIAGAPPFEEASPEALLARCRGGAPRPLLEITEDGRLKQLSALIEQATAADPADRFQSWEEFLEPITIMIEAIVFVSGDKRDVRRAQAAATLTALSRRRSPGLNGPPDQPIPGASWWRPGPKRR